jgi:hypothetical protein
VRRQNGFYLYAAKTRVRRQSDQEGRRRLFVHGAYAAFLSKQTALAGSKTSRQPCLLVRRVRNSSMAKLSSGGIRKKVGSWNREQGLPHQPPIRRERSLSVLP